MSGRASLKKAWNFLRGARGEGLLAGPFSVEKLTAKVQ